MAHSHASEREAAVQAGLMAAQLCRRVQAHMVDADSLTKKDRSPVTVADFGSQALVCRHLSQVFPDDPVTGEESSDALRGEDQREIRDRVIEQVHAVAPGASESQVLSWIDRANHPGGAGRFWALDPIDGTKGFLRGEQYAVALALIEDGVVTVAVLSCPSLPVEPSGQERGCLFVAVRGEGAFQRPLAAATERPIHTSPCQDFVKARTVESVEAGHGDHEAHELIQGALGMAGGTVRLDSQAKYGVLARGEAEIYLRMPTRKGYRECIWDQAAGSLILEEAGGKVSDAFGQPLDFTTGTRLQNNRGLIATNGPLHEQLIATIQSVAPPDPE